MNTIKIQLPLIMSLLIILGCTTSDPEIALINSAEDVESYLLKSGYLEIKIDPDFMNKEIYLLIHPEDYLEYSNYISVGMHLKLPVGINISLYYKEKPNEQYPSRPNFMACHYMKTENGWRYFIKFNFLGEYNYISEFTDYDTKQKISMKVYY